MKLTDKYSVTWKYNKKTLQDFKIPRKTVQTICYLEDTELKTTGVGIVQWHTEDSFSKEVARKESLTIAIKEMGIGKEARTTIWDAYHNRRPTEINKIVVKMKLLENKLKSLLDN